MPNKSEFEWRGATFVLSNSVWSDIMTLTLQNRFTTPDDADHAIRSDFCYVLAHLESVKGLPGWKPVDETATPEQFRACYKGLMSQIENINEFYELVRAVNALKAPKAGPLDKPDEALTEEEQADPN